eukprot:1344188-Amorphochlora_amoeboformis.AAC.1
MLCKAPCTNNVHKYSSGTQNNPDNRKAENRKKDVTNFADCQLEPSQSFAVVDLLHMGDEVVSNFPPDLDELDGAEFSEVNRMKEREKFNHSLGMPL